MSAAKKVIALPSDFDNIKLSDKYFDKFAKKMYALAGVDLPPSAKNHALVRNRIIKILRRHEMATYEEYWDLLEQNDPNVINEFISALTTNMTSFFREESHFEFLGKVLPGMAAKNNGEIRMWCCAASTGQEPYTLAMTAAESLSARDFSLLKFLSTDIDLQVLKKASQGTYIEREMQGLPLNLRTKYFDRTKAENEDAWRVKDTLHKVIRFAPFNLMNPTYDFKYKFDVIFCRNVLIYFDEPTTKRVIDNLTACLAPNGYLVLGHSESGNVKHAQLKPLSRAVYQKI